MEARQKLVDAAIRVEEVLGSRDLGKPLLAEARQRIAPLIQSARGDQRNLPSRLPRFFFGMRDGELASVYIEDAELMNALSAFEDAIGKITRD